MNYEDKIREELDKCVMRCPNIFEFELIYDDNFAEVYYYNVCVTSAKLSLPTVFLRISYEIGENLERAEIQVGEDGKWPVTEYLTAETFFRTLLLSIFKKND